MPFLANAPRLSQLPQGLTVGHRLNRARSPHPRPPVVVTRPPYLHLTLSTNVVKCVPLPQSKAAVSGRARWVLPVEIL